MGRVGEQAMHSCLLCLLALFTTTALGSWQYHLEEEIDSCDDEDFVFRRVAFIARLRATKKQV